MKFFCHLCCGVSDIMVVDLGSGSQSFWFVWLAGDLYMLTLDSSHKSFNQIRSYLQFS